MTRLEIFGFAGSTYTQTALLVAAEKAAPHTLLPLQFGAESHRALHPFLRMPALRHGDLALYETAAIAVYLDEAFDGPSLQPTSPAARGRMWQWISAGIDYGYVALVRSALGEEPIDAEARDRVLDVTAAGLAESPYLAGDAVTLADLFLAPMVRFHLAAAKDDSLAASRPALARWIERLTARASFTTLAAA